MHVFSGPRFGQLARTAHHPRQPEGNPARAPGAAGPPQSQRRRRHPEAARRGRSWRRGRRTEAIESWPREALPIEQQPGAGLLQRARRVRAVSLRPACAAAWGELGEEQAAARAGPGRAGGQRSSAGRGRRHGSRAEPQQRGEPPMLWGVAARAGRRRRLGRLGPGRAGGAGGGSGRWRVPGHRQGREAAELGGGRVILRAGRAGPFPRQSRWPEAVGKAPAAAVAMRPEMACCRPPGKGCAPCWLPAKGLCDGDKDLSCENKLPLEGRYAFVDMCASVQRPAIGCHIIIMSCLTVFVFALKFCR